jgi:hypothetical protein
MSDETVSADVRDFLIECIDSVAQLEALLLLRATPQQSWDMPGVASRLFISEGEAAQILSGLVACELVVTDGLTFRFHTQEATRRQLVERVALSYSQYLVPVTKLIHDKSAGIRKFANAFKFRKDE